MEQKITIDELAAMVQRGFKEAADENGRNFERIEKQFGGMDARFDGIDARFDNMDARFDNMDARLGRLEADVSGLRVEIVYRHEFEDALARIKYLERKLGIESGVE